MQRAANSLRSFSVAESSEPVMVVGLWLFFVFPRQGNGLCAVALARVEVFGSRFFHD
jgi:hypothetical protein